MLGLHPRSSDRKSSSVDPRDACVLAVDDVPANLLALEALLEDLDCEMVSAGSGLEALRLLLKREYAVVLLDVQMPEMDGYEVARYMRGNPATREVPIIFVTATAHTEANILRGYGSGAVDFLFKPIDAGILVSKVRVFLELFRSRRLLASANRELEDRNTALRELAESKTAIAERLEVAYRSLQATQSQLVQAAKMASLGELVAGVAHEINNPLSFVMSHLDTARASLAEFRTGLSEHLPASAWEEWERANSRLYQMTGGLGRIYELVLKLRTFSRLDEGERKLASVRECVESVLTILEHRLGDGVSVETHFGEPDLVDCFPGLLNQAIMNLVANAIDAMDTEEGLGKVWIRTGAKENEYVISIADSGCGIPEQIRERVFDPFFTTKPVGKGVGLGLSMAHSIAERHGGKLTLTDRSGGGTEATIRFPLDAFEDR